MKTLKILTLISIFLIGIEATAQVNSKQRSEEFRLIDTDGNKIIEKSEMIAFYKNKTDKKGDRIHGIVLFADLDANNDNILTLEEFLGDSVSKEEKTRVTVSPKKESPKKVSPKKVSPKKVSPKKEIPKKAQDKTLSPKQKKKEKFRRVDLDDDNVITLTEMVYFHKGKKNKNGEDVESELIFYGLDKNKDNKVTLREFLKKVDWKLGRQRLKIIESRTN